MYHARFPLIAVAILLCFCAFTVSARADSQGVSNCGSTCNGYSFQAALTPLGGGQYSLSYTITNNNTNSANNALPFIWSLTIFQSGNAISGSPVNPTVTESGPGALPGNFGSDYQVLAGKSNNGSNGNCNSALSDAICVSTLVATNLLPQLGPGQSLTFNFDFTCSNCSKLSTWTFLSSGKCVANINSNCYAISASGTAVPEPSSGALLGSELLAVLGVMLVWRSGFVRRIASRWGRRPRFSGGDFAAGLLI